jgi:solute carrier family 25 aspartate/glutamate transporter 12/13
LKATTICNNVQFDFDCTFVKQYFGYDKSHSLDYFELSQLLQNLPTEHARQAFRIRDTDKTGKIPALEFVDLMVSIRGFRMSDHVKENLLTVAGGSAGRKVSYPYFKAFNQMLGNLDLFKQIVQKVCDANPSGQTTQVQLMREAQKYPQITPLQVSLLFDLCSVDQFTGYVRIPSSPVHHHLW